MSILSEETHLESEKLFKKNYPKQKLRARLNVPTFGTCLHQESRDKTRVVNSVPVTGTYYTVDVIK